MRSAAQLYYEKNLTSSECPAATISLAGSSFCMKRVGDSEGALIKAVLELMDLIDLRYHDKSRWINSLVSTRLYDEGAVHRMDILEILKQEVFKHVDSLRRKRVGINTRDFLASLERGQERAKSQVFKGVCLPLSAIPGDNLNDQALEEVTIYKLNFGESLLMLDHFDESIESENILEFWSLVERFCGKKAFVIENTTQIPCLKGFGFLAEDTESVLSRLNKY